MEKKKKQDNIYSNMKMLLLLIDPKEGEYFYKLR